MKTRLWFVIREEGEAFEHLMNQKLISTSLLSPLKKFPKKIILNKNKRHLKSGSFFEHPVYTYKYIMILILINYQKPLSEIMFPPKRRL